MTTSKPTPTTITPMPWQRRQLSYGMKLLVTFGGALLFIIILISGITWLFMVPAMLISGPGPRDTISSMIIIGTLLTLLVALSIAALVVLWPYLTAPTSFKTSYIAVPATTAGHVFEIRYQRVGLSRTMLGKGTLRFDPEGLLMTGYLSPSPWLQLTIVLLFTLLPLLLLGIGLGIVPALIIAWFVGRKPMEFTLPYHSLSDLVVKDCHVTLSTPDVPRKLSFLVAISDGERLYRELQPRFPAALNGWQG